MFDTRAKLQRHRQVHRACRLAWSSLPLLANAQRWLAYQGVRPPLMHSVWPVTKPASSLAKYAVA